MDDQMDGPHEDDENKPEGSEQAQRPDLDLQPLLKWRPSRRVLALTLVALSLVFVGLMGWELIAGRQAVAAPKASPTQQQAAVIASARGKISALALQSLSAPINQPAPDAAKAAAAVQKILQAGQSPALDAALQAQLGNVNKWNDLTAIDAILSAKSKEPTKPASAAPSHLQYTLAALSLLILALAVFTAVTDKPSFVGENLMPSASDLSLIRDGLRGYRDRLAYTGEKRPTNKEIQGWLIECQKLLDPIETHIYSEDLDTLEAFRKDAANQANSPGNLARRCCPKLDAIIAQVDLVFKKREAFEADGRSVPSGLPLSSGSATLPVPSPSPPAMPSAASFGEVETLRVQLKTLQGTLDKRDSQLQGKNGEIASLTQSAEGERTRSQAIAGSLRQQLAAAQAEKESLQGQIDRLTARVSAAEAARRESDVEHQRRLDAAKAEAERRVRAAEEAQADAKGQHAQSIKRLAEAEAKLRGREDAAVAFSELARASPTLPKELADFVKDLQEVAAQVGQGDASWVEKNLKRVDQAVYQSPPPSSRLSGRYPDFDEPIRLHQISLVQRQVHQEIVRLGFRVIDPPADAPFDPRLHESDEQYLVWVTSPDKDNQIASVVRLGFQRGGQVLKTALVRKHIYVQSGGRTGAEQAVTSTPLAAPPSEPLSEPAAEDFPEPAVETVASEANLGLQEPIAAREAEVDDASSTAEAVEFPTLVDSGALTEAEAGLSGVAVMEALPVEEPFAEVVQNTSLVALPEDVESEYQDAPPVAEVLMPPAEAVLVEDTSAPEPPLEAPIEDVTVTHETPEALPHPEDAPAGIVPPKKAIKPGVKSLDKLLDRLDTPKDKPAASDTRT